LFTSFVTMGLTSSVRPALDAMLSPGRDLGAMVGKVMGELFSGLAWVVRQTNRRSVRLSVGCPISQSSVTRDNKLPGRAREVK
jgi:hypothetical protein